MHTDRPFYLCCVFRSVLTSKPGNRERILTDLMVRFRDVRLGPDGTIYLLTDETTDAVLRIDPAEKEGSGKNSMDRPHKL